MGTTSQASSSGTGKGLNRTLGLWNLIIIGMVIIQPIAPMGIYGVINNKAHGHVVTTILIAMVAMLFTAIGYGKMARAYPSAGSAYTYVGKEIHPALGYITGWSMVMDYILNPLICVAMSAKLLMALLPVTSVPPMTQFVLWILFFAGLFTLGNLRGIRASARINEGLCAGMVIVAIVFLISVFRFVLGLHQHGAAFYTEPFYNPATFNLSHLFAGTSVAVLTYIGFDAISTFSEEVENPRRNILWATVIVCLITGVLSAIEVYAAQLVWGSKAFGPDQVDTAFTTVARMAGGAILFYLIAVTLLVANIGSGMGAQLAAGRLLYGMGRGNALPKSFFGAIDPKTRIPRNNILAVGGFALLGAFLLEFFSNRLGGDAYEIGAQALNFGAFIAFMGVNAASFVRYWLHADKKTISNFLIPFLGFFICGFIWLNLSNTAKLLGAIWMIAGVLYGAIRTRGFKAELVTFDIPAED